MHDDDARVARPTAHYPPADITPKQFEEFVANLLGAAEPIVDNLRVTLHEKIARPDGTYDFDATVRYDFAGMSFLVLVEAKKHKNAVKRELVQVLHQKIGSVGGHKGVMSSTAPYQSGALRFAKEHGIALVTVTEGRFTFETRGAMPGESMSREEAAVRLNTPIFVGHYYGPGQDIGSTQVWLLSNKYDEYPQYVARYLLGCTLD
ncbi:MAG TPA: restriction endonuclease [Streptosporangiaceae bacterium]|nr:restriction endonuclease [Streptosporangiaceae bacterium]